MQNKLFRTLLRTNLILSTKIRKQVMHAIHEKKKAPQQDIPVQ
jgi:hypothetical protein